MDLMPRRKEFLHDVSAYEPGPARDQHQPRDMGERRDGAEGGIGGRRRPRVRGLGSMRAWAALAVLGLGSPVAGRHEGVHRGGATLVALPQRRVLRALEGVPAAFLGGHALLLSFSSRVLPQLAVPCALHMHVRVRVSTGGTLRPRAAVLGWVTR